MSYDYNLRGWRPADSDGITKKMGVAKWDGYRGDERREGRNTYTSINQKGFYYNRQLRLTQSTRNYFDFDSIMRDEIG